MLRQVIVGLWYLREQRHGPWHPSEYLVATRYFALICRNVSVWPELGYNTLTYLELFARKEEISMIEANKNKSGRNPTWSRDELILALDFHMQHRDSTPGKNSDEIAKLSSDISSTGRALGLSGDEDFRNPNGVYMKLMNFRRFDPEFSAEGKVGLERGGKGDEEVWDEFADDAERLTHAAKVIREGICDRPFSSPEYSDEPEIAEAPEGRIVTRIHRQRERSQKLVAAKKSSFMKKHGRVYCEACGFDFAKVYGGRGQGYIECHHTIPVNTLESGSTTQLKDLVLLCPNCHRMVHAKTPWLTIEELKTVLEKSKK